MEYLHITNRGLLDINLFSLMGGSTKKEDKFKIGKFGTGLKYTIAFLLRNNIHFKVFIDGEEVLIEKRKLVARETEFDVIYINGEKTSVTTQMGHDWKAWMIVREIWCNALDEDDPHYAVTDIINPEKGRTQFYIQNIAGVKNVTENWNKYFIHQVEPLQETERYAVYKNQSKGLTIYKNGVLIKSIKTDKKALFAYDIKNADINELREYKGYLQQDISLAVKNFNEKTVQIYMENHMNHWENGLDFDYSSFTKFSDSWKNFIGEAKIITQKTKDHFVSSGAIDQKTADETMVVVSAALYKGLVDNHKSMSAVKVVSKTSQFMRTDTINPDLEVKIQKSLKVLEKIGYKMNKDLSIEYGIFTRSSTLAKMDIENKKIYISEKMVDKSIFCNVGMLIEENEHYETGFEDETRQFQQHFIDLYLNQMLKANSVEL